MLFRLQSTTQTLVVKRSIEDTPVAPVAIATSFVVCLIGGLGLKWAGHGPAASIAMPIGVFVAAVLLFMSEDRRRAQNLAREGSVFDRQAGRFGQDGRDICALGDLDRVRYLRSADCNGGIHGVEAVTKDRRAFELVATYDASPEDQARLTELARTVADFCRIGMTHETEHHVHRLDEAVDTGPVDR